MPEAVLSPLVTASHSSGASSCGACTASAFSDFSEWLSVPASRTSALAAAALPL